MICWHLGIPNIVYPNPNMPVEKALEWADKLNINLSVIIKEKVS